MGFFTNLLNFETQLTFYAAYHNNRINKLIHVIFVPTILWTVLVWLSNFHFRFLWLNNLPSFFNYSGAFVLVMFYCMYYILLEPLAGLFYAPVLLLLLHGAQVFLNTFPNANMLALGLHVASWIMQFLGHGLFEKRAPALFDSLIQALLLAPLFIWLEVLFVFGYRPKLQARLDKKAKESIAQWKKSKKA